MTDKTYKYRGAPESRAFGVLQPGDYNFVISSADAPYYKNNKWILEVRLTIQPQSVLVYAHPWSGIDKNGEDRDGIAEFLLAVNRAPAPGDEPEWGALIGAKGKCRLKIEPDQNNIDQNKVAFFHRPKQAGPQMTGQPPRDYSPGDVARGHSAEDIRPSSVEGLSRSPQASQEKRSAGLGGGEIEPNDIPFACDRG